MLSKEVVKPQTLELIGDLQQKDYFKGFYLAGGTALAILFHHRQSGDVDFFSNFDFSASSLMELIQQDFDYQLLFSAPNTLKGSINNVNVDIIAHKYNYIKDPQIAEGLSILSKPDIIAMKLNLIATSGQRSKDFIDRYFLLEYYSVKEMLAFYQVKYNQYSVSHVLKNLIHYEDVDLSDWPFLLKQPTLKWDTVKKNIEQKVLQYMKGN